MSALTFPCGRGRSGGFPTSPLAAPTEPYPVQSRWQEHSPPRVDARDDTTISSPVLFDRSYREDRRDDQLSSECIYLVDEFMVQCQIATMANWHIPTAPERAAALKSYTGYMADLQVPFKRLVCAFPVGHYDDWYRHKAPSPVVLSAAARVDTWSCYEENLAAYASHCCEHGCCGRACFADGCTATITMSVQKALAIDPDDHTDPRYRALLACAYSEVMEVLHNIRPPAPVFTIKSRRNRFFPSNQIVDLTEDEEAPNTTPDLAPGFQIKTAANTDPTMFISVLPPNEEVVGPCASLFVHATK